MTQRCFLPRSSSPKDVIDFLELNLESVDSPQLFSPPPPHPPHVCKQLLLIVAIYASLHASLWQRLRKMYSKTLQWSFHILKSLVVNIL